METHAQINIIPEKFTEIQKYNFSTVNIRHDYAIGVSHAVKVTFEVTSSDGKYGVENGGQQFEILCIPNLDGNETDSMDKLQ